MTRQERLNKLVVFCQNFNKLLEDVPAEDQIPGQMDLFQFIEEE